MTKPDEPHIPISRNCTRKYWLSLHMSLISISPPKWKENNTVQVPWLLPPNRCRKWLQAIMTLQGREPTCAEAKSQLGEQQAGQKDDWGQEIEKIETGRWSHLGLTESRLVAGQSNTERKLSEQEWPKKKMKPKTWQGQIVHIHLKQRLHAWIICSTLNLQFIFGRLHLHTAARLFNCAIIAVGVKTKTA